MTKQKLTRISLIVLVLLNVGLVAFLLFGKPSHPPKHQPPKDIIVERLGFDEDQKAAFQKLIDAHKPQVKAQGKKINEARTKLFSSVAHSDSLNEAAMEEFMSEIRKMESLHYNHFLDIKSLCRGEQVQKFEAFSSELGTLFNPVRHRKPQP